MTERTEQELKALQEKLEAAQAQRVAERTAAIEERNQLCDKLEGMSNDAIGEGFRAYAAFMREKTPDDVEFSTDEALIAHSLICEILFLDQWWC